MTPQISSDHELLEWCFRCWTIGCWMFFVSLFPQVSFDWHFNELSLISIYFCRLSKKLHRISINHELLVCCFHRWTISCWMYFVSLFPQVSFDWHFNELSLINIYFCRLSNATSDKQQSWALGVLFPLLDDRLLIVFCVIDPSGKFWLTF